MCVVCLHILYDLPRSPFFIPLNLIRTLPDFILYYGINSTRPIYSEKAHRIPKFRVNWANIEQDTAIQKLKNLLTNTWIAGHLSSIHFLANFGVFEWLYLVRYWPN